MAMKRSIPTGLFASPDFFELSSNTTRLIFIGIILDADDAGRGNAHPRLLARKLDQVQEEIEHALEELAAHGMLQCYEVAGRPYYWLCHWQKYQTLSKPTPSLYPAPPHVPPAEHPSTPVQAAPRGTQESPGESWETPSEEKMKEKRRESEEKRTEAEGDLSRRSACFPSSQPHSSASVSALSSQTPQGVTEHIASLLTLSMSQELREVIQEFLPVTTLSLVGEAIEAHAWITDARRNRSQQPMTPAFFRRWLRRAQQDTRPLTPPRQSEREQRQPQTPRLASDDDQYVEYVNKLIEHYNGPEALQRAS